MPTWQTLGSQLLWESRWYSLRQDRVRTAAGHEFDYTIVDHPGAVWVVPITTDNRLVLVWHYRYLVDDWCYEVPAGGLSPRLDQSERLVQSEEVARRELFEEIGGTAADLCYVSQFYTSNGISNQLFQLLYCR